MYSVFPKKQDLSKYLVKGKLNIAGINFLMAFASSMANEDYKFVECAFDELNPNVLHSIFEWREEV